MARYLFFIFFLFLISCNNQPEADNYISEDSLRVYKQRDSLLNVLRQQMAERNKETGSVVWMGKGNCNYLIIKTFNWYYVAENNNAGGIYESDQLKGSFVQYGNMDVYDLSSESHNSIFIKNYFSTIKNAKDYIFSRCPGMMQNY